MKIRVSRDEILPALIFLGLRLVTMAWMALMAVWMPFSGSKFNDVSAFLDLNNPVDRYVLAPWARWDTLPYVQIAANGYHLDQPYTVWPPLYPLTIRAVMTFVHNPIAAALLVSNLAALAGFYLMYRLFCQIYPKSLAERTLLLIACFPTAFYLLAGYSESLFLCLVIGIFLALNRNKPLVAGGLFALAVLTRLNGLALALPIAWVGLRAWQKGELPGLKKKLTWLAAVGLGPLAFVGFAVFIHLSLGRPWPWETLSQAWEQRIGFPWEGILGNIGLLISGLKGASIPVCTTLYDLGLTLWALVWLVRGRNSLPAEWRLYAWGILIICLMKITDGGVLVSMARYTLVLFPALLAQAMLRTNRLARGVWFGFSTFSALLFLSIFYIGGWVG